MSTTHELAEQPAPLASHPDGAATSATPAALPSTGERFVPGLGGSIELEHFHRYLFAQQACKGKHVLDIACGEGYGASMLAQAAASVVGVDIAPEVVAHASRRYSTSNLGFKVGSCAAIPLGDASVDVVVSFETIEHHDEHEEMMCEIRRVLRTDGVLIISSPERFEYSERPGTSNEFHVHELYRTEFVDLVGRHFDHQTLYDQKVLFGSAILAESVATRSTSAHSAHLHEKARGLVKPVYLIAVASNDELPDLETGVFEQPLTESAEWMWWIDTVNQRDARIRQLDADLAAVKTEAPAGAQHVTELEVAAGRLEAERDAARLQHREVLAEVDESRRRLVDLQSRYDAACLEAAERASSAGRQLEALVAGRQEDIDRMVAAQASVIAVQAELLAERAHGAELRQRLDDSEARLVHEAAAAAETRARMKTVFDEVLTLRTGAARHEEQHAAARGRIEQLSADAPQLRAHASSLELHIGNLQRLLEETQGRAAVTERLLKAERAARDEVYRSTSWRITAPLRAVRDAIGLPSRLRRTVASRVVASLQSIYHRIPVTRKLRYGIKDRFFTVFGFALRRTVLYENWIIFRNRQKLASTPIPQFAAHDTVVSEPATLAPAYSAASVSLWVADGTREWEDLEPLRERIAAAGQQRLQAVAPAALPLLKLSSRDLETTARALTFRRHENPTVTILIPVYNHAALTLECLTSIANAQTDVTYEILVADDASTDETASLLALIPGIKVRSGTENLNFLRNCNAARPFATGEYILFLNNDVQVRDRWLDELLRPFHELPQVGAVGPKIVYPSGHLQEAGVAFSADMSADMVGLNDDPALPQYNYVRRVDFCSGACLLVPTALVESLGGFSTDFVPAYCEDSDLCLRIQQRGLFVYYAPAATVVHHLSGTTAAVNKDEKLRMVAKNLVTLADKWQTTIDRQADVRAIAFYLPQFYPFPENDRWWGKGFTEWTNVTKAQPNFVGHYQPHLPADLGYYDLRLAKTMEDQVTLAKRYGLGGFCFYYYWFAGKRLLDLPTERILETGKPDFPFCVCWANENWTRRWDGQESQILMAQSHSDADDEAVILDLIRYFRNPNYIRIDGRPLLVIYRVTLFPNFARTAAHWREVCRKEGIGEIHLSMVESFELVHSAFHPSQYGCDATVEFPPQGLADQVPASGHLLNPAFTGMTGDYRDLALRYSTRAAPAYTRFRGAMPGWDNTPRRQDHSFCFEHATPGAFQAWMEHIIDETRRQNYGDERIVFINAWNEWAEGAHLEPDRRYGHTFLEALRNAKDRTSLLRMERYALNG